MLHLLALFALHTPLTILPCAAASVFLARIGVRQVPILLAGGLAVGAILAMLAFGVYYAQPAAGKAFSYAVLVGSAVVLILCVREGRIDTALLRQLAIPLGLWALGCAFLLCLGFLHGGLNSPLSTAATRFRSPALPDDNDIPRYFTDWFYAHGHHGRPPLYPPDWLFSDRPPLQVGYMLLQRPIAWDTVDLHYQVIAVLLQQLWIVAAWALLLAARVRRVTRALAVAAILLSPVAILNGFFVWPKLLPAAMLVAAAALVATPLWPHVRERAWGAALVAALAAAAMLGHGASIFGLIPLALYAGVRGLPSWRWLAVAIAVGAVFMAPWSAYQKYVDPPGNRLTKEALAGLPNPDPRGTTRAIVDAYRQVGLGGALHNKGQNFVTMVGGAPMIVAARQAVDAINAGRPSSALAGVRNVLFFDIWPAFGLLAFVPLLMIARRRHVADAEEWRSALGLYAIVVASCVIWGLMMFGNQFSHAVLHQGSYALPLLGFCAAVTGARSVFPRLAIWLVAANVALMLVVYVPSVQPPPGTSYSAVAAVVAALSLAGFIAVALRRGATRLEAPVRTLTVLSPEKVEGSTV